MAWNTHPHSAEGYLYILQPDIVFQARVNMATATYPLAEITYDTVTAGAYTDLEMGMTVLIGSAPGLWDRGRTYLRGNAVHAVATSTILSIGYSSRGHNVGEVDLQDNSYITVIDLFEVWKRPSRMLQDNTGDIRKDYALTSADYQPPIAHTGNIGGLAVMDFVTGGVLELDFDSGGSYITDPDNPAWFTTQWDVKDGSITVGSASTDAITVEFPPGKRWIHLLKVDNAGQQALPRRMLVVALETSGANAPLTRVNSVSWRLTPEGVTLTAELRERLDPDDYLPGTVVILLVKEDRAGTPGSLTGFEVKFAGYLDYDRSFVQGGQTDTERSTTIYAVDVCGRLKLLKQLPSTIARESTANAVNEIEAANIDRYIVWANFWHNSAFMISDFSWSGDTTYPFMTFSSNGGSMYAVSDNLAKGIGYRFGSDSRGRLLMVKDQMRLPIADRSITPVRALTPADITRIERVKNPNPKVGLMRATASVISSASASTIITPFPDVHFVAPGEVEGQGLSERQNDYPWLVQNTVEGQERLGEDYNRANAHENYLQIILAHGGDSGIEPARGDWITVTTDSDTTGWMDDILTNERCLVQAVDFTLDGASNTMTCSLTVERETTGAKGAGDPIALGVTPLECDTDLTLSAANFVTGTLPNYAFTTGSWVDGLGWKTGTRAPFPNNFSDVVIKHDLNHFTGGAFTVTVTTVQNMALLFMVYRRSDQTALFGRTWSNTGVGSHADFSDVITGVTDEDVTIGIELIAGNDDTLFSYIEALVIC